jgi:hypothetical protein
MCCSPLRLALVACAIGSASAGAQDITLIDDGKPAAQIVLPADADEIEKVAAEELNAYLKKMSGAELPVRSRPQDGVTTVWLGAPDEETGRKLALAALPFDGFVVDCDGGRVVLAGNCPRGTRNAVYWTLEELLGVRWYIPTELGENVPKTSTVKLRALQRRVEPRFVNRRNHGIDTSIPGEGAKWRDRVRITDHSLAVPFNRYSHNLYRVLPASKYGKTHPEYYPLIGGKRRIPSSDGAQNWQPCTTNPEVIALTVEYGKEWFRDHPEANFFSVGMNDSAEFCECPDCTALDLPGDTFRGRTMVSDRYFAFVKAVADGLRDEFPGKYVSCIAYSVVESPPKRVKLPSNVMVVITQDVGQWHSPAYRRADREFARAWAKAAGAFGTYDYTGLGWLMPRVYPHAMAESLRFYDRVGAVAVTNEAWPTWWYAGPQMYVRAKLMWDPKLDCDAVLDEFYTGFFGPAKTPMKTFYDVLERCMMKQRDGRWFEGLSSVLQQMDLWQRGDLDECRRAMRQARRLAAGEEPYEQRLEFVARGFSWCEALLEEYWQAQKIRDLLASSTVSATDHVAALQVFLERTRHREQVWESIHEDELISGIYSRITLTRPHRLASWRSFWEATLTQGIGSLLGRGEDLTPEEVAALSAKAPEPVALAIRTQQWAETHPDAPNLCKNPGFEETKAGSPPPEGIDWVSTDAPPAWSKWSIDAGTIDQLTWEATGGRAEPRCVKISGVRNGCFIQVIPVKPGEVHYASAWVRTPPTGQSQAKLGVRWRDPEGGWTAEPFDRFAVAPAGVKSWRKLWVVVTVPDEAGYAVLLPGAVDQQPPDAVWFDDLRFVKLPDEARE